MIDFYDGWDVTFSYAKGTVELRRKRPDLGDAIEECRTFTIREMCIALLPVEGKK